MSRVAGTSLVAMATAAFLASLSLVAWRQARALEALEVVDSLSRELTLNEAERVDLARRVDVLESRSRVIPEARERLGMREAEGADIVYLLGETT